MAINTEKTPVITDAEVLAGSRTSSAHSDTAPATSGVVATTADDDALPVADQPVNSVPLLWKIAAVVLISGIRFGSSWSSGITGAMKSTLKKELKINNSQFSLLEASEDFMVLTLILFSGLVTDRIGGASAIMYGNAIFTIGSILVAAAAQVRSFQFMIGGRVILAIGDIATQVAQYKVFSSWFPPSNGFASTLALELGIGKIGGFAGKSSANIIAKVSCSVEELIVTAFGFSLVSSFLFLPHAWPVLQELTIASRTLAISPGFSGSPSL